MVTDKQRILVTGGSGYIGARLSLYLADAGYAVIPLCYPTIPNSPEWCAKMERVATGDIRDEDYLRALSKQEDFDIIIHLVSLDHGKSAGNPSVVAGVNITPVWSLLDIFSRVGVKKFIYFSTMQIYGLLSSEHITEQYIPQTRNAYALTHWIGEQICEHYNRNSDLQCRSVRLSNSYGAPVFMENNCWWLVVNDLCRMAYQKQKILLQSDGTPQRDFIHGWDVCRAVESIITTEADYTTYNISTGSTLTIAEIAQAVQEVYRERYSRQIPILGPDLTDVDVQSVSSRYVIDNSRLKSIGFQPEWSLRRGIHDLFDYLEQHVEASI